MQNELLNSIYIDRQSFDKLQCYITDSDFTGIAKVLYQYAVEYYDKDSEAQYISVPTIVHKLKRNSVKNIQVYEEVLYSFVDDISSINLLNEVIDLKREQVSDSLIAKLVSESPSKRDDIRQLIEKYQYYDEGNIDTGKDADITVYNNTDLDTILSTFKEENLIKMYPSSLNKAIGGGVIPQSHVIVFACPEIAKSLFTINLAACMAAMNNKKVLFIEMEDASDSTLVRFVNNITGITRDSLLNVPGELERANSLLASRNYSNITVAEVYNGSVSSIEKLIQEHTPDVVFINQLRQLSFKGVDGDTQKLSLAGNAMRRLGKKYNIVMVSIHQAGDNAAGKLTLDMRDMYMSKTALSGDVDLAIGIGWNSTLPEDRRMLSVVKNKMNGWHGTIPVTVDTLLSRVRSI